MGTLNCIYIRARDAEMVAAVRGVYPGAVGGEGAGFLAVEQPDRRFRCPEGELQGLSARLGTEVIWLGFQSVVDAFAYHHWDGGKHLRSLVYGMEQERVWERAEGTAEGWEAEVLFGDFERVMEDAETAKERREMERVYGGRVIAVGSYRPMVEGREVARGVAGFFGLPGWGEE
jgi:hypothetical protein